jgi:lysophospholipase L1-like esterase
MRKLSAIAGLLLLLCSSSMHAEEAPVRILPLGDSITHGFRSGIGTNFYNSYRKELNALLATGGYPTDFVGSLSDGDFADPEHEGHDGWHADKAGSTNDILGRINGWMADTGADVVLLHIGTNDILDQSEDAAEVSDILDEIYAVNSNATVVLALIINARTDYSRRDDISTYNSNLNIMAQARIAGGDDLLIVDMENGAGLDYASADMADKYHPSETGYDKMAANWYPSVVTAVNRQRAYRAAPPHINTVTVTNSSIRLEISSLTTGLPLRVEQTGVLSPPAWTNAGSFVPASISTNWIDPAGTGNTGFYRLVIP